MKDFSPSSSEGRAYSVVKVSDGGFVPQVLLHLHLCVLMPTLCVQVIPEYPHAVCGPSGQEKRQ